MVATESNAIMRIAVVDGKFLEITIRKLNRKTNTYEDGNDIVLKSAAVQEEGILIPVRIVQDFTEGNNDLFWMITKSHISKATLKPVVSEKDKTAI